MKEIFVLRHAKSSWDNVNLSDHDRPLADRGIKDAAKLCVFVKNKGCLLYTSPSPRDKRQSRMPSSA